MDLTLNEITKKTNDIYLQINNLGVDEFKKTNPYLLNLSKLHNYINIVNMKICNIYNICNNMILSNKSKKKKNDIMHINETKNLINKKLTNEISINIKYVEHINEIPNVSMYWVKDINQFAIRINNIILRGNIGNIYNHNHIKKNIPTNQTIICKHKNKCNQLKSNLTICKFYHDPLDLLELLNANKITLEVFNIYKKFTRNFINTSWIYTDDQCNKKNTMLRHFGSKNTLKNEIDLIKINNSPINKTIIDNFTHQTIHDLLVIIGLNQHDL
jgi:hypothetical protein